METTAKSLVSIIFLTMLITGSYATCPLASLLVVTKETGAIVGGKKLFKQGDNCLLFNGHALVGNDANQFAYAWDAPFNLYPRGGGSRATAPVHILVGKETASGGTGSKQGATNRGDRGEWQEVRRRRRKAPREVDNGWNRQREFSRCRSYGITGSPSWQSRSFSAQHRYHNQRYHDQYHMERRHNRQNADDGREQKTMFAEFLRSHSRPYHGEPENVIHLNSDRIFQTTQNQNQSYLQAAKVSRDGVFRPRNQTRTQQEMQTDDELRKRKGGRSVGTSGESDGEGRKC
ncbi:hypothetical protein TSUD_274240 [Trifolium subterraneum]|uniref:Uncharacterized protein n=1 Tax=Trifolium subterraneum TaxID=3900 RepID=A0A2Z6N526_TRISU|nr:hypothetical protein TSUD_274240 [Trifolium subterraneum]